MISGQAGVGLGGRPDATIYQHACSRGFYQELSGPEIARDLMVALSRVRTHPKSIYSKLNVNRRRVAARRAIELKLI